MVFESKKIKLYASVVILGKNILGLNRSNNRSGYSDKKDKKKE